MLLSQRIEDVNIGHEVPLGFFFYNSALTFLVITCFMWNMEFKMFIFRKLTPICSSILAYKNTRVSPQSLVSNQTNLHSQRQVRNRSRRAWEPLPIDLPAHLFPHVQYQPPTQPHGLVRDYVCHPTLTSVVDFQQRDLYQ